MFSNISEDFVWLDFQNIKSDCFRERSALADSDDISFLDSETRGNMSSNVLMSFLVSVVLFDVVQIVSSDDYGVSHFSRNADSSQNSSSDLDISSKWALLVDICSFDGFFWCFKTQTNIFVVSDFLFFGRC